MRWVDLVREVFPDVTDETADYLLWEKTGFPLFWNEKDGDTPEECCRTQLKRYKQELQEVRK